MTLMHELNTAQSKSQSSADGIALIAEFVAALTLGVTLLGFRFSRSLVWLLGSAVALAVLVVAVMIVVGATA